MSDEPKIDPTDSTYWAINKVLDELLGTEEQDGAGQGLVADLYLLAQQRDEARAELARLATPTSPPEPVPPTPRVPGSTERPEGLSAEILDLGESSFTTAGGTVIRYVLTGVRIPAGMVVGGFRFDVQIGALSWSQDSPGSFITEVEENQRCRLTRSSTANSAPRRCHHHDCSTMCGCCTRTSRWSRWTTKSRRVDHERD